jgi:hypothetical protein
MYGTVGLTDDRKEIIGDTDVDPTDVTVHSVKDVASMEVDDNVSDIDIAVCPRVANKDVIAPSHVAFDVVRLMAFPVPLFVKSVSTHSNILPAVISSVLHVEPDGVVSADS